MSKDKKWAEKQLNWLTAHNFTLGWPQIRKWYRGTWSTKVVWQAAKLARRPQFILQVPQKCTKAFGGWNSGQKQDEVRFLPGIYPLNAPIQKKKDPCRGARTKRRYASCTKIIPFWKVGHYAVYCVMPILKWKGCVGAKSKNVRAVVRREKNAIDTSLI